MSASLAAASCYATQGHDAVRARFERRWFARLVPRLLQEARGGELLDLGCGDCLAERLAGRRLTRYAGVDLAPPDRAGLLAHDLRSGLGRVGERPFDLYLGTFGVASHLAPSELRRLVGQIARHARPGSIVALEALGLRSLEWPALWSTPVGPARTIPYRLAEDVPVHPWSPGELFGLYEEAGIRPLRALDRTLQAGPKAGAGEGRPVVPKLRGALNDLLSGAPPSGATRAALVAPLPPLPAGRAALVHHGLAGRRRRLVHAWEGSGPALANAVWGLEPATAGGYGHGILAVGRVR
jgi:SAM-dependent methyltransferase